jgi:hypothetical protein
MLALRERARKEDAIHDTPIGQTDGTAIETGRLAGLDTPPNLVGHLIELALDGDAALVQLVHTGLRVSSRRAGSGEFIARYNTIGSSIARLGHPTSVAARAVMMAA